MRQNFFARPLTAYGCARLGEKLPPETVLARIEGNPLARDECDALSEFAQLAAQPVPEGMEKRRARELASRFDGVHQLLEKLKSDLHARFERGGESVERSVLH